MPLRSDSLDELRFPAFLSWFVPAGLETSERRRAQVVALTTALSLAGMMLLVIALGPSGTPVQLGQAAAAAVALGVGMLVLRSGRVAVAATVTTLALTVTPLAQAALDAGIRDPALALVAVAPLVAAMTSNFRLAIVSALLGTISAGVLLGVYLSGSAPAPISSADSLAWYAFMFVAVCTLAAAGAGALYVRHTRETIDEAEAHAATLHTALRESEERYRSLVDGLPLGLYRTAPDGRVLLANPTMARMMGASSVSAALGLSAASLYDDPAERVAFQEAIRREGFVRRYDTQWRTPGGSLREVRIDARVTLDADGEPLFYEGAVEDVTAERRVRAALAHSEARFRALVQRSSDLVVVIDAAGALSYVSPAAQAFLGTHPDLLLGQPAASIIHPDDRAEARAHVEAATETETAPFEMRLRHADGHFVYAEGVGAKLFHDPAVEGLVLNLRDVTERKRAQAVLVQAKKQAEEVAHLKSTFLANMSHEIRTPLTAILGFSDILLDEVEDPQQQEFVELIARSGRRLMETLNSVLDLARLEAGRGELACCPVRVGDAVDEAATLMGPAAAERGLTITAAVEAPHATALLDDAAFARVLHNLVGNALKFTETGGVTVRVRADAAEARVVVQVEDTGIGIDEAFLPRVFGEFEQASAGVERTHEGAGLGLAISRQLVERMDGTIAVESVRGAGTVFTLTFPLVGSDGLRRDGYAPAAARRRVLVVDDNDQARLVAERVLEGLYDVDTAESGEEALARARAARPDAVLLDIHLGDTVSGEDVLRDLRADADLGGLPVVAVTAYGLPGDRARFLALGFDDYVTKPYTRERLLGAVAASLEARTGVAAG